MIHSGLLIQALRRGGAVHRCTNCGERMFVKYASGLCPLCYNGRRELRLDEPVHVAADQNVLAGVLDDPAIEVVPDEGTGASSK
jgi:rubrerythrin